MPTVLLGMGRLGIPCYLGVQKGEEGGTRITGALDPVTSTDRESRWYGSAPTVDISTEDGGGSKPMGQGKIGRERGREIIRVVIRSDQGSNQGGERKQIVGQHGGNHP